MVQLWQELEEALGLLPLEQRLQTAGKAIEQIVEVFALRSNLLISAWEDTHSREGPAVDEDAIAGLVRQTMTLDLSALMEESAPEQRQPRPQPTLSVAGPVDKAALLEAFDSEIEVVEAQAQAESVDGAAVHDEDVSAWAWAISQWFAEQESAEPVPLIELQQALEMPMVEVWMGVLLSQRTWEFKQHGDFYNPHSVQVSAWQGLLAEHRHQQR